MRHPARTLVALTLALITTAAVRPAPSGRESLPADGCVLEYQRADNMWAAAGRPDGSLGVESIALQPGQKKVFITDWRYEKQRNDGTNFYGSHLRIAANKSARRIDVRLVYSPGSWGTGELKPSVIWTGAADLQEVSCI
ncbi:MAG TPA: hypothetical protein VFS05_17060 [Gemmatimonadaceae bacterium]|nr:hypothetical protein [Gemmatimonadaceae bacterium]